MINKIKCLKCGKETTNTKFCSKSCCNSFNSLERGKESLKKYLENPNHCLYCGKTILPKKDRGLKNTKNKKFCNESCSAKYNNRIRYGEPKVKIKKEKCFNVDENIAIGSLYRKGSSKYVLIREKARAKMNFYKVEKKCAVNKCEWNIYLAVHHKKPCNSFSNTALISEINSLDNLVYLCPNHHYEADHNMLDL